MISSMRINVTRTVRFCLNQRFLNELLAHIGKELEHERDGELDDISGPSVEGHGDSENEKFSVSLKVFILNRVS